MSYTSNLKTWGATGSEYPDGYAYEGGEQPVDEWDNFITTNVIEDIKHLINTTNDDLLKRENGSLLGSLNVNGNDLEDGTNTIWDSINQNIPQSNLQNDSVTINSGNGLTGGGPTALGGSTTLDIGTDGVGLSEIDLSITPTWTGEHTFKSAVTSEKHFEFTKAIPLRLRRDGEPNWNIVTSDSEAGLQSGDGEYKMRLGEGYVNLDNVGLRLDTSQSIEDEGGNMRMDIGASRTHIGDENGDAVLALGTGDEYRYLARSNRPMVIWDDELAGVGVQYQTSASAPGTLELTNANLDASGQNMTTESLAFGSGSEFTGDNFTVSEDDTETDPTIVQIPTSADAIVLRCMFAGRGQANQYLRVANSNGEYNSQNYENVHQAGANLTSETRTEWLLGESDAQMMYGMFIFYKGHANQASGAGGTDWHPVLSGEMLGKSTTAKKLDQGQISAHIVEPTELRFWGDCNGWVDVEYIEAKSWV